MNKRRPKENKARFRHDGENQHEDVSEKRRKMDAHDSHSATNFALSAIVQEQPHLHQLLQQQLAQDPTITSIQPESMIPNHFRNCLAATLNDGQASNSNHAVDYEANMKALHEMHVSQQLGLQANASSDLPIMQPMVQGDSISSFQQPLGSTAFFGNNSAATKEVQNLGLDQFSHREQDQSAGLLDPQSQSNGLLKLLTRTMPSSVGENQILGGILTQNKVNPSSADSYSQTFSAPSMTRIFQAQNDVSAQNVGLEENAYGRRGQSIGLLGSQSQHSEIQKLLALKNSMPLDENQMLGGILAQRSTNTFFSDPYEQALSAPSIPPGFLPNLASRDQGHCTNQGQDARPNSLLDAQEKQISLNTNSPPHDPVDLYMKCDDNVLSDYQILLRKQIEFFEAGPAEVHAVSRSRRKPIFQGQIGIRCKHCSVLPPFDQPKGAVYYPSYLRALYQAGQNMATSHFLVSCKLINDDVKEKLIAYRSGQASVGHGGKKYWEDCARAVGILEPKEGGLRFRKPHNF